MTIKASALTEWMEAVRKFNPSRIVMLSRKALPEIEEQYRKYRELVEFNRWLIALADDPRAEPYSACEQIAGRLDRIREICDE